MQQVRSGPVVLFTMSHGAYLVRPNRSPGLSPLASWESITVGGLDNYKDTIEGRLL